MVVMGVDISHGNDVSSVVIASFEADGTMIIEDYACGECIETPNHVIIGGLVLDKTGD